MFKYKKLNLKDIEKKRKEVLRKFKDNIEKAKQEWANFQRSLAF